MFRMLIDTCVWLDLAKDQRHVPMLGVVEEPSPIPDNGKLSALRWGLGDEWDMLDT